MTLCTECEYGSLCLMARTVEDYTAKDGRLHHIIGCTETEMLHGAELTAGEAYAAIRCHR
jgi:hypothetical protein